MNLKPCTKCQQNAKKLQREYTKPLLENFSKINIKIYYDTSQLIFEESQGFFPINGYVN